MWSVVMFDLPVKTRKQRREASQFRHLLMDLGYMRAQYSVYVHYHPLASSARVPVATIKRNLPAGGEIRIVNVTDIQWSKALRFSNAVELDGAQEPEQLTIF